jgi:PAS domain-containing protein
MSGQLATPADQKKAAPDLRIVIIEFSLMVVGFILCEIAEELVVPWASRFTSHIFSVGASMIIAGVILLRIFKRHRARLLAQAKWNESLRERDEHIRVLFDSAAEGIYATDLDGNCVFCNAASLRAQDATG